MMERGCELFFQHPESLVFNLQNRGVSASFPSRRQKKRRHCNKLIELSEQRKAKTAKRLWKWMKRRVLVEPGISHLKHGHRMNPNRLKGTQGDQLNAVLSAAGMNFRKLLKRAAKTCLLHPINTEAGRNPTTDTFQAKHNCC